MIKVTNLSFSYKKDEGAPVLRNIDLELDQRSTAIIGQNGAGKTTFVKLLKGLLKPDTGQIAMKGQDIKGKTAAELARTIGLIFQNPNDQIFKRTVLDEVLFGPLIIRMEQSKAREKALEALKMVGLDGQLDTNPHDLSLSEKKLLCIASVMVMDTDIIIFDEPTIAQDSQGKERIKQIIQTLKEKGKLVMTIIHDMDFVANNFERTIVFNDGRILADGPTREVFAKKQALVQANVEAPYITQLADKLGFPGTVLTIDEFIAKVHS
ncbi:energy-coupling factor ABC transporter ATP-binding protein [Neobacillus sp. Marseille-QA0830]